MRTSTTVAALSILASVACVTAAPTGTVQDLSNKENRLQRLKGADKRVQGQEKADQAQLNKDLSGKKPNANKVGQDEIKMAGLKAKDARIQGKEKNVSKGINNDVKRLSSREFEEEFEIVARAPGTVQDLTNKENRLQRLKGADKRVQGQEKADQAQLNRDLSGKKPNANKVGQDEIKMAGLKAKDARIQGKEKNVSKGISSDVKRLSSREFEEEFEIVARAPGTVQDLTNKENRLQRLKGADKRVQGQEKADQAQLNRDLSSKKPNANKVGQDEINLAGLKAKDARIQGKEKNVAKGINNDVKLLSRRDEELILEARDILEAIEERGLWDEINELD